MKTEVGSILLLIVGSVVSLPLVFPKTDYFPLLDDLPDKEQVKDAVKNDEVRVEVSHGSSSGTSGSITYSHDFYALLKSLLKELAADPVVKELAESNHENGRIFVEDNDTYFPFKNSEADEALEEDKSFEDTQLNELFPKIEKKKNNEVRAEVKHDRHGTSGSITYTHRFPKL